MTEPPLIALVDDDEAIRDAMRDLLESVGLASIEAESSEAFLGHPRRHEVTCIVLDVNLPGLSGLALQQLLADAGDRTPVVFLTSVDDAQVRERAMRRGAECFLAKPVDSTLLLASIRRASRA